MGTEAEMLPFLAQPKEENNGFKNKEQPELPEKYLHRSPTTKELKKHSTRGRRGRDQQQGRGRGEEAAGGPHRPHVGECGISFPQTSLGESRGARQTLKPGVSARATKDSKPQCEEKICGDCGDRRNSQPHRRVCWRDPQGPKHKPTHPQIST